MRRSATLAVLVSAAALIAAAPPGFVEADHTFYLRGAGCGATEDPYLSRTSGTDELDGCGGIGGLPFNEIFHQAGLDGTTTFSARDGVPVRVDSTRNLTGQIRTEQWLSGTVSAGQIHVEATIYGTQQGKSGRVTLGTFVGDTTKANAANGHNFTFDIDIPDTVSQTEFTSLSVDVDVRGLNQNNSNLGLEGDSFIKLPVFVAAP